MALHGGSPDLCEQVLATVLPGAPVWVPLGPPAHLPESPWARLPTCLSCPQFTPISQASRCPDHQAGAAHSDPHQATWGEGLCGVTLCSTAWWVPLSRKVGLGGLPDCRPCPISASSVGASE